ncbi:MAG: hypothetical protein ACTHNB_05710 [Gaiellaceae bacterium]
MHRLLTSAGAGLAVLLTVLAVPALAARRDGENAIRASGRSVRVEALVVVVPSGFNRRDDRSRGRRVGITVADARIPTDHLHRRAPVPEPQHGVVLGVWADVHPVMREPRVRLPLSFHEHWQRRHIATQGAWRIGYLRIGGQNYGVLVWIGRYAPPHDHAALLRALTSIRRAS